MIDAATELYENDEKVLENALAYAETAISTYKELCKDNHDKIRELFSWEVTMKKQVAVYGE